MVINVKMSQLTSTSAETNR